MHFSFEDDLYRAKVASSIGLIRAQCLGSVSVAYSGGKDSDCLRKLVELAGISAPLIYNVTTFDPPEVVQHVRFVGAAMLHPGTNYFREIEKRGLPTRWRRWCCRLFKHSKMWSDTTILGVRVAESSRRRKRWTSDLVELPRGRILLPIRTWSDSDVWRFLRENNVEVCSLYSEGFKRLGCIGCPLARGSRLRDFARWPGVGRRIESAYRKYVKDNKKWDADKFWSDWVHDRHGMREVEPECEGLDLWSNL